MDPFQVKTSTTETASYAGSLVSIGSSLTLAHYGIIIGIITALLTFALNFYYTHKRDQREEKLVQAKMKALLAGQRQKQSEELANAILDEPASDIT